MFLAHVAPFYPKELAQFPTELVQILESSAKSLLPVQLTKALTLLVNRKVTIFSDCIFRDLCENLKEYCFVAFSVELDYFSVYCYC